MARYGKLGKSFNIMQEVMGHYCMELGHYNFRFGSLILWCVLVWLHKGKHGDEAFFKPQSHKKGFTHEPASISCHMSRAGAYMWVTMPSNRG